MGIIYKVTNNINGKIYIGKTVQDLSIRKHQHESNKVKRGLPGALQKYGKII